MATIDKKLIHFNSVSGFKTAKEASQLKPSSIIFVGNGDGTTGEFIHTRGETYFTNYKGNDGLSVNEGAISLDSAHILYFKTETLLNEYVTTIGGEDNLPVPCVILIDDDGVVAYTDVPEGEDSIEGTSEGSLFKTIAYALADLNKNKQDLITADNKLSVDLIEGTFTVDHTLFIKKKLTGVTIDNALTQINHGSPYQATLTDAEEVHVVVGGVDFTDEYYDAPSRTITIPYVSGNIYIEASNTSTVTMYEVSKSTVGSVYIDNSDSYVIRGASYDANVVINEGYLLESVQVLMAGMDITTTVYDEDTSAIHIEEATGNISIVVRSRLKTFNIIYQLNNTTSTNLMTSIEYGKVYSTVVNPDLGYDLTSCKVVFTDEDGEMTEETFDDGIINLSYVTTNVTVYGYGTIHNYDFTYNLENATILEPITTAPYGSTVTLYYELAPGYDYNVPGIVVSDRTAIVDTDERSITIMHVAQDVNITMSPALQQHHIDYVLSDANVTNMYDNTRSHGEMFTTTIAPNMGYEITSVQVVMGVTELSGVYNNNVVTIPSVTDDVKITVETALRTFAVTNTLPNGTTNNVATVVTALSPYEAVLSPNPGYKISTIRVTMGGDDISNDVCTDNTIYIPSVVGDIEIIATYEVSIVLVSYVLNGVVSSNNDSDFKYGHRYNSTLSFDDSVYSRMVVTITMDGRDITDSVYSDGEIYIPSVTGNVAIVANAITWSYYPIIYTLNNITVDDITIVSIREDGTYTTSYTPTVNNPNFEIKVMVNGENVTADVVDFDTRTITVTNPTGAIELTLSAEEIIYENIGEVVVQDPHVNIQINDGALPAGDYYLRYDDENSNPIDNYSNITDFTI